MDFREELQMKALLYCTKAKPYLDAVPTFEGQFITYDKDIHHPWLNGFICAECDIDSVEEIKKEYHVGDKHFTYYTNTLENDELIDKSCAEKEAFCEYMPRYVLYLSNVKAIEPFEIVDCVSIPTKSKHSKLLVKAPQNMQMTLVGYAISNLTTDKYLVISVRPEYLCKILNGEKTIEVRRVITKELKELIK